MCKNCIIKLVKQNEKNKFSEFVFSHSASSKNGAGRLDKTATKVASLEGLDAHKKSVEIRQENG